MHIHPSSPNSNSSLQSEEECAAIKIQAGFRGYRVRKQLHHHQTRCTNATTNGYHTHHHHRHAHRSASHRRRQQQTAMEQASNGNVRTSSVVTPGSVNGVSTEVVESATIEDRCATKIQAGVRGFLVRKKQKIATDAATKIQAGFRGFKARKETQKMKQQ